MALSLLNLAGSLVAAFLIIFGGAYVVALASCL